MSQKGYTIECVPPLGALSGLVVNPLVQPVQAGKSTLVSIKYNSDFRDLTYKFVDDEIKPSLEPKNEGLLKGIKNKRLADRIKQQKEDREANASAMDTKGGKKGAPPAKKEDPKAAQPAPGKAVKKTQQ